MTRVKQSITFAYLLSTKLACIKTIVPPGINSELKIRELILSNNVSYVALFVRIADQFPFVIIVIKRAQQCPEITI